MKVIPGHVLKAIKQSDHLAIGTFAQSGGRARARGVAMIRAEQQRRESEELDRRIKRLEILVKSPRFIEEARIAALGYDALAD